MSRINLEDSRVKIEILDTIEANPMLLLIDAIFHGVKINIHLKYIQKNRGASSDPYGDHLTPKKRTLKEYKKNKK